MNQGDLRMLGAADGLAKALVLVRLHIGMQKFEHLPEHYKRKRKKREDILRPLREIEMRLLKEHTETKHAYTETCKDQTK